MRLHVLDTRQRLVHERRLRRDLAAREPAQAGGQRLQQRDPALRAQRAEAVLQELALVERALLADDLGEGLLVARAVVLVVDAVVVHRLAPQAHDLVHRRDALRAHLDAAEAVRAVVDAVRVLGEVAQPLLGLAVTRVADEPVGLGERGRPDEERVHLERQAVRVARAAVDARHRLRDVDHRLRRHDVLALGRVALRQQPRHDALDLLPVHRVHVHDQVLEHGHVAHRLDHDRAVVGALHRVRQAWCCRRAWPARSRAPRRSRRSRPGRSSGSRSSRPRGPWPGGSRRARCGAPRGRPCSPASRAAGPFRARSGGFSACSQPWARPQYFLSSGCHCVIVTGE